MNNETKKRDLILIVSDKTDLKNIICGVLEDEYRIISASSVPEALSAITLKLPDMFIVDIDLPLQSGIELLKKIREGIKTKLIPFLLLSPESRSGEKIEAMEIGADDYLSYPFSVEELKAVVKLRLNKFKEFYLLSITDELTRLYNRREFIKKFNDEISEFPEKVVSLSILDIDHFKKVNDIYGHQMGDIVLMKLAEVLKSRASENFFAARFGGEEFVILFPVSTWNGRTRLCRIC
jgi:PleD family two-component response regulator